MVVCFMLLFNCVNYVFLLLRYEFLLLCYIYLLLRVLIVKCTYSYCYVCSVLGILSHSAVLCIVGV
jgi:hypothetical protein